jgi:putative ABC transport system permease protein
VLQLQRNGDPVFVEILSTFAGLALLLSAIGIYGLIAYSVRQRTQEFGIRVALGANARDIATMVLREGITVAAIGSALGLILALPLGKAFESMFPGIQFTSPGIYPVVLIVMIVVASAATWGPARRAMNVDPTAALRNE